MWHSQHLSPLFGVQREISHPDSRRHLFSSTAGRGNQTSAATSTVSADSCYAHCPRSRDQRVLKPFNVLIETRLSRLELKCGGAITDGFAPLSYCNSFTLGKQFCRTILSAQSTVTTVSFPSALSCCPNVIQARPACADATHMTRRILAELKIHFSENTTFGNEDGFHSSWRVVGFFWVRK